MLSQVGKKTQKSCVMRGGSVAKSKNSCYVTQKTPKMGSFAFKIALKNATKNATSKKETLESQCYQGFAIVNVTRIGYDDFDVNVCNVPLILTGLFIGHNAT